MLEVAVRYQNSPDIKTVALNDSDQVIVKACRINDQRVRTAVFPGDEVAVDLAEIAEVAVDPHSSSSLFWKKASSGFEYLKETSFSALALKFTRLRLQSSNRVEIIRDMLKFEKYRSLELKSLSMQSSPMKLQFTIVLPVNVQFLILEPAKTVYLACSSSKRQFMKMHMSKKQVDMLVDEKSQPRKVENEKLDALRLDERMSRPSKSPPMMQMSFIRPRRERISSRVDRMMRLSSSPEWWKQVRKGGLT